ncbi:hypothetical protein AX768_29890 (plasmid) [Burkholderia sp. PAMC 28687]|nr:hypothetical protein AX768_29890 [Burkholderia sp. PAMC 28687]
MGFRGIFRFRGMGKMAMLAEVMARLVVRRFKRSGFNGEVHQQFWCLELGDWLAEAKGRSEVLCRQRGQADRPLSFARNASSWSRG